MKKLKQEMLEIGQIVNTFGVKGMVKIVPYTDDIRRFDKLKEIYVVQKNKETKYEIEEVKYHKNMVLLKLKNIDTMNDAELLKQSSVQIERKDAIDLEEDSYFIVDLIGLKVVTDEQVELGNVVDIFNTGSNDIYVVKDELGKQVLLPAISDVIKKIDMENKLITVHLIKGLV